MFKRFVFFLVMLIVLDVYVIWNYKKYFTLSLSKNSFAVFYGMGMIISYSCFALVIFNFDQRPIKGDLWINIWFGYTFAFMIFKLCLFMFWIFDDVLRLIQITFRWISHLWQKPSSRVQLLERRKFIGQLGLGVASLPFVSMLYGITKGKYNFKIKEIELAFRNLPKAFDQLKIVHVSDIHSGSFDDYDEVKRGVALIKEQQADLFLFTGDLVNNQAEEIIPYKSLFEQIKPPLGKFSTLGNHDYGTHKQWKNIYEKEENLKRLFQHQKDMGFQLLNNKTVSITKGDEKIDIVGVENWGNPPFPQKGDLDQALKNTDPHHFKILLSHDPTHWDEKVISHPQHIDLTLSGHTHGMQFGVEIPGFKWSPSKYIYKRWAGLYQKAEQYLYVNRGFGFLGFPGRVGIWPEITVITLKKGES